MKIIDLLNKIANGEEVPPIIKYNNHFYYNVGSKEEAYYENDELDDNLFFYALYNESSLNDEVKIIEDTSKENKKIEKLNINTYDEILDTTLASKINEIIDRLNGEDNVKDKNNKY